jgi:hypothetical protein
MPNVCAIFALTTARRPIKKTLRPRKTADTIMTVGPCDAATVVVVVVVVAISDASPKYSTQRKIIAENEIINDAKIILSAGSRLQSIPSEDL